MVATPTYRLSDIEVEEISLVDRPANQRGYLVAKREKEDVMEDLNVVIAKAAGGETVTFEKAVSIEKEYESKCAELLKNDPQGLSSEFEAAARQYSRAREFARRVEYGKPVTDLLG